MADLFFNLISQMRISWILTATIVVASITAFCRVQLIASLALHPYSIRKKGEYYRLLSADLIHYDWIHLGVNLMMLLIFCTGLEEELIGAGTWGSLKFLLIYTISTLSASIFVTLRYKNDFGYTTVGPSGSIIGCVFSVMILKPKMILLYIPGYGGVENIYSGLMYIILTIWNSRKRGNVNHELHFAGGVGGALATILIC